ncbi:MAG TPA: glycosyl hydrolase family 18 protein [Tepidiformaceae bacterium]
MTRRGGAPYLAVPNRGGLYGGGGGYRRLVTLGAVVLGVVVLGWFLLTRMLGGDSCTTSYCPSGKGSDAPEGYTFVSKVYEFNAEQTAVPPGTEARVSLPLLDATTDGRNLAFYRFVETTGAWEPLGPALLDAGGETVSATLPEPPPVIAVMRRLLPAGHVVAYLPHNGTLHPEAQGRITVLHSFDFTPSSDGTIAGELTPVAASGDFAFYPVISAGASQRGSIPIVSNILADGQNRSRHVQEIVRLVAERQLGGIDIAYLDLAPDQRTSFSLFVSELGQALRANGKVLTLTLPPPMKVQDRIDEGAYDWQELGKSADILKIWPYRDQSTYRRDMPAIIEHLTTRVEVSKLVLTVTPYATEKTIEGLSTMTLAHAMSIATRLDVQTGSDQKIEAGSNVLIVATNIDRDENLSGVLWDARAASVGFTYKSDGPRTVWIENFFSIGFKLEYIYRHKLGGVAVEDASDNVYLGNIWTALVPFIASGQPILMQPNPSDLVPFWKPPEKGSYDGGERAGQRGSVRWATPTEPGTYTISLRLSDGVNFFENEITVTVEARSNRAPVESSTPTQGTG